MKKITFLTNILGVKESIRRWSTVCLMLFFLGSVQITTAQVGGTYAFAQTSGTYTAITGGTVLGTTGNDDHVFNNNAAGDNVATTNTGFPIGFNFVYNGVTYDKFAVNSNGWIKFGTGSFIIAKTSTPLSSTSTDNTTLASAMGMDLIGQAGSELSYLATGTAPNRKLIVQWKGYRKYQFTPATGDLNFQIVINETSNSINIIYGAVSTTITGNAEVGIKGSTNVIANINNRTSATDWSTTLKGTETNSTVSLAPAIVPPSGLTFTWTPVACTGTPVAGATTTVLSRNLCTGASPGVITIMGAIPVFSGIVYQWEESTNGGTSWANVTGGTDATTTSYTPPVFAGTSIQYRFRVTCLNGNETVVSDVTTLNPQIAPDTQATAIGLGNAGTTAFTASWTNGTGGRRMVVVSTTPIVDPVSGPGIPAYVAATAFAGTGQQIVFDGTGSSVTVTGLTCNTPYYVKVFEYNRCGSGPYDVFFNTTTGTNGIIVNGPTTAALPLSNNFTGFAGSNLGVSVPGWYESSITTVAGDAPVSANPVGLTSAWTSSTAFTSVTAKINLYINTRNEWIISPKIPVVVNSRIKLKAAITNGGSAAVDPAKMTGTDDKVTVLISSDACGAVWTPVYTFDATTTVSLTNVLQDFIIPIPASYNGQTIQIAFQATDGPIDNTADYDFHIGNVLVEAVPNCDKPVLTATTNITKNSATINWNVPAAGVPTGYQYVVSTTNTVPVGAGTNVTTTTANVPGLAMETVHYVFVRTVCGIDFSDWTGAGTFKTLCDYPDFSSLTPASRCGLGTVTLQAASSGTIKWYTTATGGTAIATGSSFTTPVITDTTTFYATSQIGNMNAGGKITPEASWTGSTLDDWGIIFTAIQSTTLSSVDIFSTSNGTIDVKVTDSNDVELYATGDINVTAGGTTTPTVIPLNFAISAGTEYKILVKSYTGVSLVRGSSNLAFPYTNADINVTSSEWGGVTTTNYYYFFNIKTGTIPTCLSPRVPVIATVNPAPALVLSAAPAAVCSGATTTAVTITTGATDYDTYTWTPSTGVTGSAAIGWTFNPSVTTVYTLNASQSTGALCAISVPLTITITTLPVAIVVPATAVCEGQSGLLAVTAGNPIGNAAIGNGTTAPGTSSHPNPFNAWYGGHRTQMLYRRSELEAQGLRAGSVITSASFDFATSANKTCFDLTIRIGATSNTTTTAGFVPPAGLTTVYHANYTPVAGATGLVPFAFTTSYVWDGESNIVVEVVHNQGNSGNGVGTTTNTTTTTFDSAYYLVADSVTPAGADSLMALDLSTITSKGVSTSRPNIVFAYNTPLTIVWSPQTGLYTDAAATVPYTGGNTASVYTKPAGPITYTVTATNAGGCSVSTTTNVTISVVAAPTVAAPTQDICNAGTVANLVATGTGIKWYAAATGGTALVATTALVNGTVYYASQTVSGCESVVRTALTANITVVAAPTVPAPTQEFCNAGTVADLVATGTSIKWYAAATGGTALVATTALVNGTIYYASQTVGTCESAARIARTANVNVVAAPTVAAPTQNICGAGTVADLVVTGTSVKWYAASTGGTALVATTSLVNGTIYYASQTVGTCEGITRTALTANIIVATAPTVAAPTQDICNAGTVADLVAIGTGIKWYATTTGGTALIATTPLVDDVIYYASQTISGCESTTRTALTANITVVNAPTVAAAIQDVCNAGTVADLLATGTDVKWYADATGETALVATTPLVDDVIYYASQTIGTCESATRTALTVNVNVTPAPTGNATQAFCGAGTVANLVATGTGTIVWYDAATEGNVVTNETAIASGTIYYASQSIGGCESLTRLAVEGVITTVIVDELADVNECYQYFLPVLTNGAYFTEPGGQGAPLPAGGLISQTATVYIYASAGTNPVCTAESSFVVTIANVPTPQGEATQTIAVDTPADATIADIVVTLDEGGTITWYATLEDASNGSNPLPATTELVDGEDYYGVQTIGTCTSILALKVTIDVTLGRDTFNKDTFTYYPNPVKDILNLSYTSDITAIAVFNLLGQQVISQQPNAGEAKLDMSSLADGAYIVNVTSGSTIKTIKVIKKQ